MYTKEKLEKWFTKHRVLTVTFTKVNGSERVMTCTQDLSLIPEDKHPKGDPKPPSDTTCTVWEIDNGWRSFRYENVTMVGGH